MRNLLITLATLMVLSACQKDNFSDDHKQSEKTYYFTDITTELETRDNEHSVSGKVWEDKDGDGIRDFDDSGLEGVKLLLKSISDNSTEQEYITDDSGEYFFDIEIEGEYYIVIELGPSFHNYIATIADVIQIEALDSDVTHTFGRNTSEKFSNDYNGKLDFGFYEGATIGNQVWIDKTNISGGTPNVFDGGDDPLPGAIMKLYSINFMTGAELLIDSTITNSTGNYLFQKVASGSYIVEIQVDSAGLNNSHQFVSPNIGNDDCRDSDLIEIMNFNGQTIIGRTGFIDIAPGEVNLDTDIGISDQSAVICFFPPNFGLGTSGAGGGGSVSPNGTVWIDTNADGFQRSNEPTMEGVTINLINSQNDSIIQTVKTDKNGYYEFDRINNRIANCYLQISQPRGYMLTKNVSGSCYPTNDFDQKTRKTATFRTSACPYYSSYDAGLVEGILMLGRKE